ncbi:MAG: DNA mismatch repair endonuclease MutL [bacterium]|nr:DNA mismatch repair endonuclease MutL [bacterium]
MSTPRRPVRLLPPALVHKIAAGEVIERPASVVKELVENSLDAGARRIEVVVEAGGKNFIQVEDDGGGMDAADARLAVEAHATSKLATLAELEAVATLGFRGEALATIAAVSRFELRSCPAEGGGLQLWIADGRRQDETPWTGPPGTRITVRNLFFSTPARRKFLATTRGELRHVLQTVRRIALAHPEVALRLVSDGQELANWPAAAEEERIAQVFGPGLREHLLPVDHSEGGLRVRGWAGAVNTFRRAHGDQHVYINGRPIASRLVNHAAFAAYGSTLPREMTPFLLLFLETDPARVDVNVHPAKREVRFEDERFVHGAVQAAVTRALRSGPVASLGPAFQVAEPVFPSAEEGEGPPAPAAARQVPLFAAERPADVRPWSGAAAGGEAREGLREYLDSALLARERFGPSRAEETDPASLEAADRRRDGEPGLFQLHRTYILAQVQSGLIIVDQHVAHERILYERCLGALRSVRGSSQRLLFPVPLQLDEEDRLIFEELLEPFLQMGFAMEMAGGEVLLTGIPAELRSVHPEGLIQEVLDQFRIEASILPEPGQALAASVACKAAVKAGQPLNQTEMRSLLDELFACDQPYTCPHGRPVVVTLGLGELNRRFDRS